MLEFLILLALGLWLTAALRFRYKHKGGCAGCDGCCDRCDRSSNCDNCDDGNSQKP